MENATTEDVFRMMCSAGVVISNPMDSAVILCNPSHVTSWAEKKRDRLVYKMKKKKALLNIFIVVLLMIPISILTIIGVAAIGVYYKSVFVLSILGAEVIIIAFLLLIGSFECDSSMVRVKHKGKNYYY